MFKELFLGLISSYGYKTFNLRGPAAWLRGNRKGSRFDSWIYYRIYI